jgi:hypothetical protein
MRCGAIPGAVVLEESFCLESGEIRWSSLGNWTVQFAGHYELVPATALVSAFTFGTLPYSAATSSGPFSTSGFASSLAKVSLLSLVCP